MTTEEESLQKVVKFVQELLSTTDQTAITPELIGEKIDQVVQLSPAWGVGLDRAAVTDELIRRFSLWVGQDTSLSNDEGHIPWLDAARKRKWRYWQRYREWLERRMALNAVDALDTSTDLVLSLLEDPQREGVWDRRGLVVGHVQSGKTGHYTGLVNKAADAGYKIIIVLAGLHNNLRSQTQMRLDEGFLGYETKPDPEHLLPIGVGEIDRDPAIRPNFATNRSNNGDFTSGVARNLGITPEQRPWLFVVKKNKTVLERLLGWITHHVANTTEAQTGRRIVTNLPLLLIDDEADNASVDTGETVMKEDGTPDEEHEPTAINRHIRKILYAFTKSAYVGYTATPFANIFIHEQGTTKEEGADLFPAAFIVNLAAPSTYVGPAKVFGSLKEGAREGALPLIISVTDAMTSGWMPISHKNGHQPLHENQDVLPPSLIDAIDDFLLAAAAKQIRLGRAEHSSMLIHVTRFTIVQDNVHRQVEERVRQLRQRLTRGIESASLLTSLKERWEGFLIKSHKVAEMLEDRTPPAETSWAEILAILPDIVSDIQVRKINGTSKDALDYADQKGLGLRVIAIGGDKLARGLTLEGLCTSYFLRASRMYDTLMQMGRWFGYRPGYLDLCRLYTTPDLIDWFGHIADAAEELRDEFDFMAASGATPREYGLKVQSHSVLMVTSRLKMRAAKNLMLSFSGQLLETILLYRDNRNLEENIKAANALLSVLPEPERNPERSRGDGRPSVWEGFLWNDVPAANIVQFLLSYRTHPEVHKVNSQLLAEFIENMARINELTHWTVAFIGGGEGTKVTLGGKYTVNMLKRVADKSGDDRYAIGRLMSPRDEAIDFDESAWLAALEQTRAAWHSDPGRRRKNSQDPPDTPNGPAVRHVRGFGAEGVTPHPERGVLYLYALDPALADLSSPIPAVPVMAMAVSFPGSRSGIKVEYKVNNVEWKSWQAAYDSTD